MTDLLLNEVRVSLTTLAGEQSVSAPTVWRWAMRGVRGHRLETFNLGVKRFTTREAFRRWLALINGEPANVGPSRRQLESDTDRAEAELIKAGA